MLCQITEKAVGQPCEQCHETIVFPAFKVEGMLFCTPACAFDYEEKNHYFPSPDVMTYNPCAHYNYG